MKTAAQYFDMWRERDAELLSAINEPKLTDLRLQIFRHPPPPTPTVLQPSHGGGQWRGLALAAGMRAAAMVPMESTEKDVAIYGLQACLRLADHR